jgi:hypothetical protein
MKFNILAVKMTGWVKAIGATQAAFLGSLLLSFIARQNSAILNRDGMLYIETAKSFLDHGFPVLTKGFDWVFFPLLIAGVGAVTRLDLEAAAFVINALLLAGACALMVDMVRRRMPAMAWSACLIVLAMPAYNGYRDYLLREFGCWFFTVLSFWLAMRWEDGAYRWRDAIACQLALVCAVLFRLEAAVYFMALVSWQLYSAPAGLKVRHAFMIGCVPFLSCGILIVLIMIGALKLPVRIEGYLHAANIFRKPETFHNAVNSLATVLPKYSKGNSDLILFVGLLSLIPVKFVKMCGVFILPLVYGSAVPKVRIALRQWHLMSWAFLVYLLTLIAFLIEKLYLSARYVSTLNLLIVPVVTVGFVALMARFPRWKAMFLALAFLTMLANVVSLSPRATPIPSAGAWIAENATNPSRVFVEDPRIAYYAGWGYSAHDKRSPELAGLTQALASNQFDMVVLSEYSEKSARSDWISANQLQIVKLFPAKAGEAVVVAVPIALVTDTRVETRAIYMK